jgi:hypothetical protein
MTSDPTITCDSCGSTETTVWAVHRLYVTPADWDTEGREQVDPEVERWCFACLASYPHEPVADG